MAKRVSKKQTPKKRVVKKPQSKMRVAKSVPTKGKIDGISNKDDLEKILVERAKNGKKATVVNNTLWIHTKEDEEKIQAILKRSDKYFTKVSKDINKVLGGSVTYHIIRHFKNTD